MNNAPLTLILIAAIGLVVVLSLGVFFAVKPQTRATRYFYYEHPPSDEEVSKAPKASDKTKTASAHIPATTESLPSSTSNPTREEQKKHFEDPGQKAVNYARVNEKRSKSDVGKLRKADYSRQRGRDGSPPILTPRQPLRTSALIPSHQQVDEDSTSSPSPPLPPSALSPSSTENWKSEEEGSEGDNKKYWSLERRMPYGKVVGLAYYEGRLIAPSHDAGKISILGTPELREEGELDCPECRIYDAAVLPGGEIILAQGKRRKLSKLSAEGRSLKELHLNYATKGLATSRSGLIYVLARSHDRIQVYDSELEELHLIYLPNDSHDDCNFLAVDSRDRLIVSCETEVFIMEAKNGEYLATITAPPDVSYSMGVDVDSQDNIYLAQRGRSLVDVFSPEGTKIRSLGSPDTTLWSDLVVADDGTVYVVDYISAVVKAIPPQ